MIGALFTRIGFCLVVLLLAAASGAADETVIDAGVVGTWKFSFAAQGGDEVFTWTIGRDNHYRSSTTGPLNLPAESGAVTFKDGQWTLKSDAGRIDGGTYKVKDAQTMEVTGTLGSGTWTRVGEKAQADAQPAAAPTSAAVAQPALKPREKPPGPIDYSAAVPGEAVEDMPANTPGLIEYGRAIDALAANQYDQAVGGLDRAIKASPQMEYYMARGVARVCSNHLADASADFAKARQSRPDEVAYTWSAAVATMRGEAKPPPPTRNTRSADSAALASYRLLLGHAARLYPNNPRMASEEFPQIARRYAVGQAVQAFLLGPVMLQARELVDAGKYDQAMPLIDRAWKSDQPLFSLVRLTADCRLGQGDFPAARTWYTNLIMLKTNDARGYANRALVMAKLSRMNRARADLSILSKLDPKLAAATEKSIAPIVTPAVVDLADRESFYPDEEYQEDLRRLSDAVRADPENPDALTKLAEYIDDPKIDRDFTFPGGIVQRFGIRMESHDYGRERAVLAAALKRDPRHVGALTQTACMLSNEQQWPLCQSFVQRALDLGGRDPALLLLYMDFCTNDAEQRFANAADLRQTKVVGFSRVERGDGSVETSTTYRMPSTDDLAQAAALDQQSVQLRRQGAQPVLDGIKRLEGTQRGYYLTAKYFDWIGHEQEAQANMRKAVALDPFFIVIHGQAKVTLKKVPGEGGAPERIDVIEPAKSVPAPQRGRGGNNNAAR